MKKAEKRKVVLIGTGMVGMSYAYAILNQNLCDELVLIDINKKKAEGEAMDLNHGVAFSGGNMEIYAGEYSDCRDADLIVLTAGLPQKWEIWKICVQSKHFGRRLEDLKRFWKYSRKSSAVTCIRSTIP